MEGFEPPNPPSGYATGHTMCLIGVGAQSTGEGVLAQKHV